MAEDSGPIRSTTATAHSLGLLMETEGDGVIAICLDGCGVTRGAAEPDAVPDGKEEAVGVREAFDEFEILLLLLGVSEGGLGGDAGVEAVGEGSEGGGGLVGGLGIHPPVQFVQNMPFGHTLGQSQFHPMYPVSHGPLHRPFPFRPSSHVP